MSRNVEIFAALVKAVFETSVNVVLDAIAPPCRPTAIPIRAMADREWARAVAARRQLSQR